MKLFEYLDRVGERRARRDRSLDTRFWLAVLALGLFAYVLVYNPTSGLLIGAVITLATTAINYFLGSSKGSADKSDELSRQASGTQQVEIKQPPGDPVPVEEVR